MSRWIGSDGTVENLDDIDKSGTSYFERRKLNRRNLNDLIHYFEYAKDTGYPAARVDVEQEEHWALLLRDFLIRDIIEIGHPILNDKLNIIGYTFECLRDGLYSRVIYDDDILVIEWNCNHVRDRENDIIEFFERFIKKIEEQKKQKNDEEKEEEE